MDDFFFKDNTRSSFFVAFGEALEGRFLEGQNFSDHHFLWLSTRLWMAIFFRAASVLSMRFFLKDLDNDFFVVFSTYFVWKGAVFFLSLKRRGF